MQMDQLMRYLAEHADIDVPAERARFQRETGLRDFDRFLGWLHTRKVITGDTLRDLHGRTPVALAPARAATLGRAPTDPQMLQHDPPVAEPAREPAQELAGNVAEMAETLPGDAQAATLVASEAASGVASAQTLPAPRTPGAPTSRQVTGPIALTALEQGIDGRGYEMLGEIASGAMGEVLVARDRELMRKVAYKRMRPHLLGDSALAARFLSEVQITAQLDHPNIVPIHELEVTPDGRLGYSMKLIQGQTLSKLIKRHRAAAKADKGKGERERLNERLDCFLKVADAMSYAHDKGVLHRDLKPDNVMVGRFHEIYVMDWGICRLIDGSPEDPEVGAPEDPEVEATDDPGVGERDGAGDPARESIEIDDHHMHGRTSYGAIMGTPGYMSPEQAEGRVTELDRRSDVYALGLILFELVCLRPAITGDNVAMLLMRSASGERDRLVHALPRVPIARELRAIIDKAIATDLARRYHTVGEMAEDLRAYLRGDPVAAAPDTIAQTAQRWIGRHKRWTLSLILFLLLAGSAATIASQVQKGRAVAGAHAFQERVQGFLMAISQQAHAIDSHFFRLEQYQERLAGDARAVLTGADSDQLASGPVFFSDQFDDPTTAPADLAGSAYYGHAISAESPVIKLAPGVTAGTVQRDIAAVGQLRDSFVAMMLATSHGSTDARTLDAARRRALIADEGGMVLHAFLTLHSGVHASYPGKGGYPAEYDGRDRPKYTLSANRRGIKWGNPFPARSGRGLILPSSASIYGPDGQFLGVIGIEVTFEWIRNNLLTVPEARYVEAAYLVDERGRVVISTDRAAGRQQGRADAGQAGELSADLSGELSHRALDLQPLPYPAVVAALAEKRAGHLTITRADRRKVVAFYPVDSLGWWYVAVADEAALRRAGRRAGPAR